MNRLVYVAGPYTGTNAAAVERNLERASEAGREVLQAGLIPCIPHRITAHWDAYDSFKDWRHADWLEKFCYPLLSRCDMIYLYPGWDASLGARAEKLFCEQNRIPVGFTISHLLEIAADLDAME